MASLSLGLRTMVGGLESQESVVWGRLRLSIVPAGSRQPLPNPAAYEVVKVQDSPLLAMVSGESSRPYHCVLKVNLFT